MWRKEFLASTIIRKKKRRLMTLAHRLGGEHESNVVVIRVSVIDRTILNVIGPLVVDNTRQLGELEHGAHDVVGVKSCAASPTGSTNGSSSKMGPSLRLSG
jgi:hypothetical protein